MFGQNDTETRSFGPEPVRFKNDSGFFPIQNIYFFTFEYIQQLPRVKEYRLK